MTRSSLPIHPKALFHETPNCFSIWLCLSQPHNTHTSAFPGAHKHTIALFDVRLCCQDAMSWNRCSSRKGLMQGHGIAHWHCIHAQQLICHAVSSSGLLIGSVWCVLHSVYWKWKSGFSICTHLVYQGVLDTFTLASNM